MREGATHAHTHRRAKSGTFRDRAARGFRRVGATPGNMGLVDPCRLGFGAELCWIVQKSAEKFWRFGFFSYLCRMKDEKWVVTAVNKLTRVREEISGPMSQEMADERCRREIDNRRHQRFQTHTRLRVEKRLPVQLTLQFNSNE